MRVCASMLLAFLMATVASGQVSRISVTNQVAGMSEPVNTTNTALTASEGVVKFMVTALAGGTNRVNFVAGGGNDLYLEVYDADISPNVREQYVSAINAPLVNYTNGQALFVTDELDAGLYVLKAVAIPKTATDYLYPVAWHYLAVTSAPASGVTLAGDVTINYPTGGTVSNIVASDSNHWDAATGTYHYNTNLTDCYNFTFGVTNEPAGTVWTNDCTVLIGTNDTAGSDITITTNGTGNVVTNLTTDGSGVTMELGTVSSDANTLEGYTAQEVADLPRSTADLDFTTLTWAQTTSISRADGVFQRLVTEGPSWVRVPAGLTNSGYMINLEIAATTNPITFLPDNILIATNLYTYTNRTMSFLLHNAWDEETVGVYGLKRDND